jgi:exosome complex RNA-binding protein Rrp42 (RNase PH superfamily)
MKLPAMLMIIYNEIPSTRHQHLNSPPLIYSPSCICLQQFASDDSSCIVRLGRTMVMASISASLEAPYADRHSEGSITFDVLHTAMAGYGPDFARKNEDTTELSRLVERGLRESRAIDLEALCVQPGRKVWHLQVDVRILDNCGNAIDAVGLAALGALCAFRRPDVTVDPDVPGGIIIHSRADREPLPLTMHHLPLPITFAFFEAGDVVALDPMSKEEAAASGSFTVTVNPQGELCAAQKAHGVGILPAQVMQCTRIAATKVKDLTSQLRKALEEHEIARVAARVRRHQDGGAAGAGGIVIGEEAGAQKHQTSVPPAAEIEKMQLPDEDSDEEESEKEEEESEEEEEGNDEGEPSSQEEEEEPMEVEKSKPRSSSKSKSKRKAFSKAKRRRSSQQHDEDGGGDTFAAIAELIVNAGGKGGGGSAGSGGLEGALKKKPSK